MDSSAPPSAVTSQSPLHAAANRFKDLIGGIFKEVFTLSLCLDFLCPNFDVPNCRTCSIHTLFSPEVWLSSWDRHKRLSRLVYCCMTVCFFLMQRKPWGELADRTSFSRPASLAEVHCCSIYRFVP